MRIVGLGYSDDRRNTACGLRFPDEVDACLARSAPNTTSTTIRSTGAVATNWRPSSTVDAPSTRHGPTSANSCLMVLLPPGGARSRGPAASDDDADPPKGAQQYTACPRTSAE